MPDEVLAALQNDDWAARLEMWNKRAVTAEAEVERLEERLLEEQRANTFNTLATSLTAPSEAGTPLAGGGGGSGFQRLGSVNSYRSASGGRPGTLSASWGPRPGTLSATWAPTSQMPEEDDGWLYDRGGQPLRMTWYILCIFSSARCGAVSVYYMTGAAPHDAVF